MAAAIEQDPAKPYGSVSKYMPGGTEYHKIFFEGNLADDYRLLLYPYLVKSYCEKEFHYGSKKSNMDEKKYARLLYVTTYYQAILEYILSKNVDLKTEPKVLDKYFEDFETNKKLRTAHVHGLTIAFMVVLGWRVDRRVGRSARSVTKTRCRKGRIEDQS